MKPFLLKILAVCAFAITMLVIGVIVDNDPAMNSIESFISEQNIDKTKGDWKSNLTKPPLLTFSEQRTYYWKLVTNKGPIVIELFHQYAPMHVSSTIFLTKIGFYDNLKFHRIITGFMAQGGDPLGSGRGNPGYRYDGEFTPEVSHDGPGILSMANAGPGTDGSQFFITFKQTRFLDGKHTVFGKVVSGMDTLEALETFGSQRGTPSEEIMILTASITTQKPE